MRNWTSATQNIVSSPATACYALTAIIVFCFKSLKLEARPETLLGYAKAREQFEAFPSGHAAWSAMLLVLPYFNIRTTTTLMNVGAVLSIATCLLRLVARKHWPQNLLAGLAVMLRSAQAVSSATSSALSTNNLLAANTLNQATIMLELCALLMSSTTSLDSRRNRLGPIALFAITNGVAALAKRYGDSSQAHWQSSVIRPFYNMATEPVITITTRPWDSAAVLLSIFLLILNIAALSSQHHREHIPFTITGGADAESKMYKGIKDSTAKAADIISYVTGGLLSLLALFAICNNIENTSSLRP